MRTHFKKYSLQDGPGKKSPTQHSAAAILSCCALQCIVYESASMPKVSALENSLV